MAATAAVMATCTGAHAFGPVFFPSTQTAAHQSEASAGDAATGENLQPIDAALFFQRLVQRYRTLRQYEDEAHLVEVTQREGEQPQRRESQLRCEITDAGELKIRTPARAALGDLGLDIPFRTSDPMREMKRGFELWLAPHLGLRFWDDPLRSMQADSDSEESLQPRSATPVKVGDRDVVQLELSSDEDADADGHGDRSYDLYVDRKSMLVERVEGRERLPDGAQYETTLEITSASARAQDGETIELPPRADDPQPAVPSQPPVGTDTPQTWDEPADDDDAPAAPPSGQPKSGGSQPEPAPAPESPDDPAPAGPPTMHSPR